jgi:gliding motility-associated-like protein
MIRALLLVFFILTINISLSFSQNYQVLFKNGVYEPQENKGDLGAILTDNISENQFFYGAIQFYEIPKSDKIKALEKLGVEFSGYLKNNAYAVAIPVSKLSQLKNYGVRSVFSIENKYKKDELLLGKENQEITVWVNVYKTQRFKEMGLAIRARDFIINYGYEPFELYELTLHGSRLESLLSMPEIQWVQLAPPENVSENLPGLNAHRANILNETRMGQRGLTGKGIIAGEWDGAGVGIHIDYQARYTNIDPFVPGTGGEHATHVLGTMGGAGNLNPVAKGMAHEIYTYAWDFIGNVTLEMDTSIGKYNFVLTQNSYGYNPAGDPCTVRGRYDGNSRNLDIIVNKNPHLLHVYANGNSRSSNCISGGYRTVGSGYQSAKNVLTVGAVDGLDVNSTFSSYGPALDGRIKPDVTAVGVNVFSCNSNNNYGNSSGTSMACPGTSGTAALLYEHYRNLNSGSNPHFHTLKAALCNTARDLGRKGPDFMYGYGRIDGDKAANVLENNLYLVDSIEHEDSLVKTLTINSGGTNEELRIFLCWEDKAAAVNANPSIINNLDLFVITPSGDTIRPLVPRMANVTADAVQMIDNLNTNEQVVIDNPADGDYKIVVLGTEVPDGKPSFTLTWWEFKREIRVTHPIGGEIWAPPSTAGSARVITWDAMGVSGTFTVEISTDSGATWTTLASGLNNNTRAWSWSTANANLHTTQALVRVTASGSAGVVGISDSVFTIMPHPQITGPQSIKCSERLTLFWNGGSAYSKYDVYMLIDGRMEVIGTTKDTFFVVKNLTDGQIYWFAISPYNTAGFEGRRSLATSHVPGGDAGPEIVTQPFVIPYCAGDSLQLFSEATGAADLFSRWEISLDDGENWNPIPLQDKDSLIITPITTYFNHLQFRNAYYNHCGGFEYTDTLIPFVDTTIEITVTPDLNLLCIADTARYAVSPTSYNPPKFYWEMSNDSVNWFQIGGSDSLFELDWENVVFAQSGFLFRPVANNICGIKEGKEVGLIVRPPLSMEVSSDTTLCSGQTVELSVIPSGGDTMNYVYLWEPTLQTDSAIIANPTVTTSYKVTLFDNCSADSISESIVVSRRDALIMTLHNVDTTLCVGSPITLSVSISGGLADSIKIFTLEDVASIGTETFNPTLSGYYGFKAGDGCSEESPEDSIFINFYDPLQIQIDPVDTLCVGESIMLNATPSGGLATDYEVLWETEVISNANYFVQPGVTTTYEVRLNDNCTVLGDTAIITVVVRDSLKVNLIAPDEICLGSEIQVQAEATGGTGIYQYDWTPTAPDNNTFIALADISQNYSVVLRDNCSENAEEIVFIAVNPLPNHEVNISPSPVCAGKAFNLNHQNANPASIVSSVIKIGTNISQTNNRDFDAAIAQAGTYDVHLFLQDDKGCEIDTIFNDALTVVAMPIPSFSYNPEFITLDNPLVEFTHTSTNHVSVFWDFGQGSTSIFDTENITYTDTGLYAVTLTATNSLGCDSSITKMLRVTSIYKAFIPNAFSPDDNNLNEIWRPVISAVRDFEMKVFNRWGEMVFHSTDHQKGWNGKFNNEGDNLPEGVYIYTITVYDIHNERHSERGTIQLKR